MKRVFVQHSNGGITMDTGKATFFGLMLIVLSIAGTAESGWAADKDGKFTFMGAITCGEYLDAYSKSTLTGDSTAEGQHEFWKATGFINGYNHLIQRIYSQREARRSSWHVQQRHLQMDCFLVSGQPVKICAPRCQGADQEVRPCVKVASRWNT